jgi:hypothetical protein
LKLTCPDQRGGIDAIQALPILADDLQTGGFGQSGQLGQRILYLPRRSALLDLDADQKGGLYRCGFVCDITPPCLVLLRLGPLFGAFLSGHLLPDLADRHLDDPPAKVALRRIMFGTFLLVFLQPGAC